ncbi:SH3 domain-containing protein [Neobacillus drentensis]|uniref:SH3 domain-containing protein n=1 Tax=Neobacillus drentensis TaxID=220684 RepID=UPI001F2C3ED3|nr:SH3 domain-containing protein [Neobacillus drentensis]ULT55791.1 SH3 domain-containing protein [Neobacillus drentensis]
MSKKFTLFLFSIILIFGTFLPQGKGMASSGTVTISTDTVNVRSGPGLSYPLTFIVKRGEKYSIVKETGDWIEIKLALGQTGWIVNWLVTKDNETNSEQASTSTGKKMAKANTDQLRIRSGPGTSFPIVGFINQGQEVTILDQNENWYKITSSFGEGWVIREFLDIQTGNSPSASSSNPKMGTVTADTINIRTEASASSPIIGKLTYGTNVTIISKQNSWLEISYSSLKGWVKAEFIETQSGTSKDTPKNTSTGEYGTVTAESLSVRSDSSLNAAIIGSVAKGQQFAILEENNNWAKIEYESGSYGWVSGWYLEKTTASTPAKQSLKDSKVTILHNGTNIRQEAKVQSNVVALANEGDSFIVKRIVNDWYEIKLKNGRTGFVAGWIASMNGSNTQIQKSGAESYLKNKTIVLDPGHGGGDNGTTGANGTLEKELTLRTARLLYDKLRAAGANVTLTRSSDSFITLPSRVNAATANDADAFISLHYDSSLDRSVRGMTGYYYYNDQEGLADSLYTSTVAQTKLEGRGVRFGDFHVIRENSQKAALIELGYLSDPQEEITLNSGVFQENAASGLYEGLARYFKNN